jgi:CSLREA domain-containing protein
MAALLLGCSAAASAGAATLTVTTNADSTTAGDGQCSLREAIEAANSPGSPGDCGTADALSNAIVFGTEPVRPHDQADWRR